jgi:SPP1 gp7 family putative phage head morphogenesis protein
MATKTLRAPDRKPIRLPPVRANAGLTVAYQKRLDRIVRSMALHVEQDIRRAWRANPPHMARDESPAAVLRRLMSRLATDWTRRFADFGASWSKRFTGEAARMSDRAFAAALRKAGFTVKFTMNAAANDVMQATIAEQVGLIRSIPQQFLGDVQGAVMRSVQQGRTLAELTAEIQAKYGIAHRRAATIARDQNNKATASITRVRQQELGITQAIWLHSAGGKVPRPTHVANSGKIYNVAEGWLDPALDKRIWPGTEINCRCVARPIIPGL